MSNNNNNNNNNKKLYIGSYSTYLPILSFNSENGEITYLSHFNDGRIKSASWLSYLNNNNNSSSNLLAVSEVDDYMGTYSGSLSSYIANNDNSLSSSSSLSSLSRKRNGDDDEFTYKNTVSSLGAAPCHSTVFEGEYVMVSNYCSGSFSMYQLDRNTGEIGTLLQSVNLNENGQVDETCVNGAHTHQIVTDEANSAVFVVDLGLNKIFHYKFDNDIKLLMSHPIVPSIAMKRERAGPRHLIIHPTMDLAFVINELENSITSLIYNRSEGYFTHISNDAATVSSLRIEEDSKDMYAAEIQLSPFAHNNGRYLYVSNRDLSSSPHLGRSSIAVFRIGDDGLLENIQHVSSFGIHPRYFTFDDQSTGKFILITNRDSNNIVVLSVHPSSGLILDTNTPTFIFTHEYLISPTHIIFA